MPDRNEDEISEALSSIKADNNHFAHSVLTEAIAGMRARLAEMESGLESIGIRWMDDDEAGEGCASWVTVTEPRGDGPEYSLATALHRMMNASFNDGAAHRLEVEAGSKRWEYFRQFLSVESDLQDGGEYLYFTDNNIEAVFAKGFEHTVEELVDQAIASGHSFDKHVDVPKGSA